MLSTRSRTAPRCLLLLGALLLVACSTGNETPTKPDRRRPADTGTVDLAPDISLPDVHSVDKNKKLDTGKKPDTKLLVDKSHLEASLCGNKKVDSGETCDKGIATGQPGACPQSVADCDDKNKCTTDGFSGAVASCTAVCTHTPIANCCGNGTKDSGEECDDGNITDNDGCSNTCKLPGGHLLITEVAVSPSEAEFIEIYNPSTTSVSLDKVYIADRYDYFQLTGGTLTSASNDFVARFPAGSTIGPGQYIVIAIQGSLAYKTTYGKAPDFELTNSEASVPDMVAPLSNAIGSQAGLTDGGELLMLFTWDGTSDRVQDLDYVVWKGSSATAVFKNSSVCLPTCYANDTDPASQSYLTPPAQGGSLHRCNYLEGAEKKSGGNGATGHDETSEPLDGVGATWKRNPSTLGDRTPAAPAPAGFCPI
jgi:cysteine-rich repeat protein